MKCLKILCISLIPTGWTSAQWEPFEGHEYYYSSLHAEIDRMWFDARDFCMSHGGDLASIHNDGERDFIFGIVSTNIEKMISKDG